MPSQALKTRKRFVAKTGSSFVKCEETGANVPCSMIKLHHCSEAGKAALMELVEEKNEQFLSGKWVPFDPLLAKSHANVSHATRRQPRRENQADVGTKRGELVTRQEGPRMANWARQLRAPCRSPITLRHPVVP